jgi:hypothetical protein
MLWKIEKEAQNRKRVEAIDLKLTVHVVLLRNIG